MEEFKEYTVKVSFLMNAKASSKTEARINVLNRVQFPGHSVANLVVTVKDLPDDKGIQDMDARRKDN